MQIIDMKKLENIKFSISPYQYAVVSNIFYDAVKEKIWGGYPSDNFNFCKTLDQEKTYSMYMKQLVDSRKSYRLMSDELNVFWQMLIDEILSEKYISIMSEHVQRDLKNAHIEVNCWKYSNGCWLSPHTDKPEKIVSQLFYFNEYWDKSWGGGFRILNSNNNNDVNTEIFPDINTSVVLVRSDFSWHSVDTLLCPKNVTRKLMQIIFWER